MRVDPRGWRGRWSGGARSARRDGRPCAWRVLSGGLPVTAAVCGEDCVFFSGEKGGGRSCRAYPCAGACRTRMLRCAAFLGRSGCGRLYFSISQSGRGWPMVFSTRLSDDETTLHRSPPSPHPLSLVHTQCTATRTRRSLRSCAACAFTFLATCRSSATETSRRRSSASRTRTRAPRSSSTCTARTT